MSEIITNKLTGKTAAGNVTITDGSATMTLQSGVSKSWASYGMDGTAAIDESLNTSSLTDNSTGDSTIAFSSNMDTALYCVTIGGDYDSGSTMDNGIYLPSNTNRAASSLRTRCVSYNGGANDNPQAFWTVMGDLA